MSTIDDIKDGIIEAGKYVTENASLATSKAGAKLSLQKIEKKLDQEYLKIGKEYVASLDKKEKEKYKELIALEEEYAKQQKEMNDLNNFKVCSKCGNKINKNNAFCEHCGSKLN